MDPTMPELSATPSMELTDMQPKINIVDDHEIDMAKAQVFRAAKSAMEIHKLLMMVNNLEGWMQAKITLAADYLEAVASNLEYDVVSSSLSESAQPITEAAAQKVDPKILQAMRAVVRDFNRAFKKPDIADKAKGEQIDAVANALSMITDKIPHHGATFSKSEETRLTKIEKELFNHFEPVIQRVLRKEADRGDLKKAITASVKKFGARLAADRKAEIKALPKVDESVQLGQKVNVTNPRATPRHVVVKVTDANVTVRKPDGTEFTVGMDRLQRANPGLDLKKKI